MGIESQSHLRDGRHASGHNTFDLDEAVAVAFDGNVLQDPLEGFTRSQLAFVTTDFFRVVDDVPVEAVTRENELAFSRESAGRKPPRDADDSRPLRIAGALMHGDGVRRNQRHEIHEVADGIAR